MTLACESIFRLCGVPKYKFSYKYSGENIRKNGDIGERPTVTATNTYT